MSNPTHYQINNTPAAYPLGGPKARAVVISSVPFVDRKGEWYCSHEAHTVRAGSAGFINLRALREHHEGSLSVRLLSS